MRGGGQEGCGVGSILISICEVMSLFKILPCTINVCCYFYTADYV